MKWQLQGISLPSVFLWCCSAEKKRERETDSDASYSWPYFLTFSLWNLHAVLISCFSQNKNVKQQSPLLRNKSRLTDFRNHSKYTFVQSWHMCTYDFPNLSWVTQYQLTAMKTLLTAITEYTAKKGSSREDALTHTGNTRLQELTTTSLPPCFSMRVCCVVCLKKDVVFLKRKLRWESCENQLRRDEMRYDETNKNRQEKIWRDKKDKRWEMKREQKRRYETRWEKDQKKRWD